MIAQILGTISLILALTTWYLFDEVQDLNKDLGIALAAIDVCKVSKQEIKDSVKEVEAQIEKLKIANEKYKSDIEKAQININDLETDLEKSLKDLRKEILPESCEGRMNWMLQKALDR